MAVGTEWSAAMPLPGRTDGDRVTRSLGDLDKSVSCP